jgi:hypothetical protein
MLRDNPRLQVLGGALFMGGCSLSLPRRCCRRFGLRITPDHRWIKTDWKTYRGHMDILNGHAQYVDIMFQLAVDWFKDPVAELDKSKYGHPDASRWIDKHAAGLSDYRRTLRKAKVRNLRELNWRNQKVRDALTADYRLLVSCLRKKASEARHMASRNSARMTQYMIEENDRLAVAMETLATQIEREGEAMVQRDAFIMRN